MTLLNISCFLAESNVVIQEAQLNARVADRTAPSHTVQSRDTYLSGRRGRLTKDRHTFGNWYGSHPGSWTPVVIG